MPRYLMEWETDPTKIPIDPKERGQMLLPMAQMVKQDVQNGFTKEWGNYLAEGRGFAVVEGSEEEVSLGAQKYVPFVHFKLHPFITIDQVEKIAKELMK